MTTQQPPQRKAHPPKDSMRQDGLPGIFGTRRSETATGRIERGYQILIQGKDTYKDMAHGNSAKGLGRSNPGHDFCHQRAKFRGHLRKVHGIHANAPFGHDDNVGAQAKIVLVKPEKLPDQTLDPIAPHGLADFSAHRESKTPGQSGVFPLEHKECETL